jgi:hypothetical protein
MEEQQEVCTELQTANGPVACAADCEIIDKLTLLEQQAKPN